LCHRFKGDRNVFCMCREYARYVYGADPDSLCLSYGYTDIIKIPFYTGPRNILIDRNNRTYLPTIEDASEFVSKVNAHIYVQRQNQKYERRHIQKQPQNFNTRR
jgi:hypothetical protein